MHRMYIHHEGLTKHSISISSIAKTLTWGSVWNISGLPRHQEDVDWWHSHCVAGAGLQITDIHACGWGVSDDRGVVRVVVVAHHHLIKQDFAYRVPGHSGRALSRPYKSHSGRWLHHFQERNTGVNSPHFRKWPSLFLEVAVQLHALTCGDCPDITLGTSPSTVGGVNVTVVCRGGCQAFHSSTQGCEGLVVSLCGKAEQLLHKQDVAVCPYDTGPLKLYRCTRDSSGKGDLRCGGHCGNVRWGIQYYSKKRGFFWLICSFVMWLPVMVVSTSVHTTV